MTTIAEAIIMDIPNLSATLPRLQTCTLILLLMSMSAFGGQEANVAEPDNEFVVSNISPYTDSKDCYLRNRQVDRLCLSEDWIVVGIETQLIESTGWIAQLTSRSVDSRTPNCALVETVTVMEHADTGPEYLCMGPEPMLKLNVKLHYEAKNIKEDANR